MYSIFILFINLSLSVQVVELQNRLSEESKKADKMEFEYKRVKEKVDSLQKEKDVCTVYFYWYKDWYTLVISSLTVQKDRYPHIQYMFSVLFYEIRCSNFNLAFCTTSKKKVSCR